MRTPQSIRFLTSRDGTRIACAESGSGPPLIKVANWLSHLDFESDSPVWRHWLAELSARYRLIRYDQRGCGLSDWDATDVSFDAWVRDLELVVEASGLDRFPLLCLSQGASIGIRYAVTHPERVSHLLILGGYARGRTVRAKTPEEREMAAMLLRMVELGWGQSNPAFRTVFTARFMPEATLEQQQWFNELQRVSASPANAVLQLATASDIDVTADLRKVRCPTLVLHATGDGSVPFEEGKLMASEIPGARFVPLDGSNHVLLETEPAWRRFLQEAEAFLPRNAAPVPAFASLTPRERDIVELIAQGRDNAQIAAVLSLGHKTVRNHITHVFYKLEVENRAQAIVLARKAGFGGP